MPDNIIDIWHYGFTGILNNAIDHSSRNQVHAQVTKTITTTDIVLYDDGEGTFFSSRMFDDFAILSGNVYFSHKYDEVETLGQASVARGLHSLWLSLI